MHFYRKCWFDPFEEQFISPLLSDCPSLMLGIAIHCIQHSRAMLERGVCELAHSFFHCIKFTTCTGDYEFQTVILLYLLLTDYQRLFCFTEPRTMWCRSRPVLSFVTCWETCMWMWGFTFYQDVIITKYV